MEWTHRRITAGAKGTADDGKGVVLSLLRTREGSNILAEAAYLICFLLFQSISFQNPTVIGSTDFELDLIEWSVGTS